MNALPNRLAGDRAARAVRVRQLRATDRPSLDLLGMNDCWLLVVFLHRTCLSSSMMDSLHLRQTSSSPLSGRNSTRKRPARAFSSGAPGAADGSGSNHLRVLYLRPDILLLLRTRGHLPVSIPVHVFPRMVSETGPCSPEPTSWSEACRRSRCRPSWRTRPPGLQPARSA